MTSIASPPSAARVIRPTATSIAGKFAVAVTGLISFGYVFGHMAGNLQVFLGQDRLNTYAAGLKSLGPLLWFIRAFLLAAFIGHIYMATKLKLQNMAARPVAYRRKDTVKATLASRTMILSGLTVLAFVIYHVLHFTAHVTNPEYALLTDSLGRPDVYSMVIIGFSSVPVSSFYILAVLLLSIHLSHGVSSMFQSLGFVNDRSRKAIDMIGWVFSALVFVGFTAVPVGVMLRIVTLPSGGQ